ncbi:MAG: hypothetical protein COB37_02280 [Kordiimonadales bacterium]|nr:MAG: hypothetical protein COB37_02280 [Kordiimonadales bacterium]
MVDINSDASSLQSRLQAQLQAEKSVAKTQSRAGDTRPGPRDAIDDRIRARRQEVSDTRRSENRENVRNADLSSAAEIDSAKESILRVAGNTREAPIGRTSLRLNELRDQPLGQIIDIRV